MGMDAKVDIWAGVKFKDTDEWRKFRDQLPGDFLDENGFLREDDELEDQRNRTIQKAEPSSSTIGTCVKRSLQLGFAYAGIKQEVPAITWTAEIREFAGPFGLKFHAPETDGVYKANNDPVMVVYADDRTYTDSIHHAVFCSDIAPCLDKNIKLIVYGWRELKERESQRSWLNRLWHR